MGEGKAVKALADFLEELAVGSEFPQPGLRPAEEGEGVALGIGGHALHLAHGVAGGHLEEIRHRLIRQVGRAGIGRGRGLRESRNQV